MYKRQEVYRETGETISEHDRKSRETPDRYDAGSATPIMWWGTPSISAGVGAAVPMAMPR